MPYSLQSAIQEAMLLHFSTYTAWKAGTKVPIDYIVINTVAEYGSQKADGTNVIIDCNFATSIDAVKKATTVPNRLDPLSPIDPYLCFWQAISAGA